MKDRILDLEDIIENADDFILINKEVTPFERIYYLNSTKTTEICPDCGHNCSKVKTKYRRKIKHGARDGKEIILNIQVHQFLCDNPDCSKKSFSESVPFVEKWQQRTKDMNRALVAQAVQSGFRGSAAVLNETGISISHSSIRRLFSRVELKEKENITFIGIDDVAIRKGHTYMTAFYDGTTHEPINLIDGRYGDSIINYLEQHPKIRWAARDRDSFYAKALSVCLPDCIQVADRFHLIYNANEKVTEYLGTELDRVYYFKDNELISRAEYNKLASEIKTITKTKSKKLDKVKVRKPRFEPQVQEPEDPETLQKRRERIDAYLDYQAVLKPHPGNIVIDSRFFLPPDRIVKTKNKKGLITQSQSPK